MSQIRYDYAGIESVMSQATQEKQQLVSLVEEMTSIKNQTASLWDDPQSAEAFRAAYTKWISGSHELQQVLGSIINAASQGSSDMHSTNTSIANSWA